MTCAAIQHSDQMQCGRCGLAWDVGDAERPACLRRAAGALNLLSRSSARAAGVTDRANERRKPGPFSTAQALAAPQAEGVPVAVAVSGGSPLVFPGRRSGKTAEAERWMREAVASGEVTLQRFGAGDLLGFRAGWRMPAELPEGALDRMAEALCPANGEVVAGEGLRAAYRELLAYLGQA